MQRVGVSQLRELVAGPVPILPGRIVVAVEKRHPFQDADGLVAVVGMVVLSHNGGGKKKEGKGEREQAVGHGPVSGQVEEVAPRMPPEQKTASVA